MTLSIALWPVDHVSLIEAAVGNLTIACRSDSKRPQPSQVHDKGQHDDNAAPRSREDRFKQPLHPTAFSDRSSDCKLNCLRCSGEQLTLKATGRLRVDSTMFSTVFQITDRL